MGPDYPALGLSWNDAQAYAAWRGERDGRPYALPTQAQWDRAAGFSLQRSYPYGEHFEPKWAKSCFSRREPWPEPVMSYPIDESCFGVFDMSGSVGEWLDDYWGDPKNDLRPFAGGSWAYAQPNLFKINGGNGLAAHMAYWMFGLRLVSPAEQNR
jgi:formylglycine-generating enzyme required for sulfatase activity